MCLYLKIIRSLRFRPHLRHNSAIFPPCPLKNERQSIGTNKKKVGIPFVSAKTITTLFYKGLKRCMERWKLPLQSRFWTVDFAAHPLQIQWSGLTTSTVGSTPTRFRQTFFQSLIEILSGIEVPDEITSRKCLCKSCVIMSGKIILSSWCIVLRSCPWRPGCGFATVHFSCTKWWHKIEQEWEVFHLINAQ